jgi:uncharacterized membrane protein YbhN (UPF0104 family)
MSFWHNQMSDKSKKILKLLIRIAITSGLLVWVFHRIDRRQFAEALQSARWHYLIAVWIVIVVIYWFESIKMRLILNKQNCIVGTTTVFRASAVAALYSMILPGMLSVGVKWYILKKSTGKGTNVLSSMVYNQFTSIVVMVVFALGALILTNPAAIVTNTKNQQLLPLFCALMLAGIVLFCLLLLNRRTGEKIIRTSGFILRFMPESIRRKALQILEQVTLFQVVGWRFHLLMVLITSVGILVGGVVMYWFAAKAANIFVPLSVFVWLWPIIFVLQRVPISIANLGVREATLTGLLPIYGIESSDALMMSMILFSALVFMAFVGGVFSFGSSMKGVRSDETV